jgi:hypothetical protein
MVTRALHQHVHMPRSDDLPVSTITSFGFREYLAPLLARRTSEPYRNLKREFPFRVFSWSAIADDVVQQLSKAISRGPAVWKSKP